MTEAGDPYVNEYGRSLFDLVLAAYDHWLDGVPYVGPSTAGVHTSSRRLLLQDVYPAVRQLCIRLEANGKGELASRIERDFRDVEDCARSIDNYCESDKFDLNVWLYGDLAQDRIAPVSEPQAALLERARALERPETDDDFHGWSPGREWALDLGERCEKIEIEKYGHTSMPGYARHVAYWAWACFWLAVQLRHQKIDHHRAYGSLEEYSSSMAVVSETKHPVIHEALGRAYGMSIYPIEPMESEEVLRAIESFGTVVTQTQTALSMAPSDAAINAPPATPIADDPVTLVDFMRKYCQDGDKMSPSILDSRRNSIHNAAQLGTIALPDNVGKWKTGKSKYYRPSDLAELWDEYRNELPNLPLLKPTDPSPGGQTA